MNLGSRRQAYAEERQRQEELADYFADRPWKWGFTSEVPVQTRKTRKMIKDEQFQLIRASIRREA